MKADPANPSEQEFVLKRRTFLVGGTGLSLGLMVSGCDALGIDGSTAEAGTKFGAYIEIANDGIVTIVTPGAEMGQGVSSSLPKIVAEELGADWSTVKIALSGVDPAFGNPDGRQRSANSDAVMKFYEPLRKVGASAREMLVSAAAARWETEAAQISVANGVLTHNQTGDTLSFADVAEEAAKLPVPENPVLKNPDDFTLIGRSEPRKDIPDKVTGKAVFGMDVELPDMLYAAIKHVPVIGAKLDSFDASAAQGMPGVLEIVPMDDAIAVVAESYWQAQQAVDAIQIADPPGDKLDSTELMAEFRSALDKDAGLLTFPIAYQPELISSAELSEVRGAIAKSPRKLKREYSVPYLAHATMEPMVATAKVEAGACEIWAPTQAGDAIAPDIERATGIAADTITIHRTYIGGGFGRKNDRDFMIQAVKAAQAKPGRPVKLIWSRAEDMQHDYYRPAVATRYEAGVASDGTIRAWHGRAAAQPLTTSAPFRIPNMADPSVVSGIIPPHYPAATKRVDVAEMDLPIKTSFWRSVASSSNVFFAESMVDEIAQELGLDPLAYRLQLLGDDDRSKAVLELAAEKAGWGSKKGHGIAFASGWNAPIAQVVEVALSGKQLVVEKITCAVDCGLAIDPDNVISQVEGGIIFGLSAALFGQITIRDGRVRETAFGDYPVVTLANVPQIDVHLLSTPETIGGIGEAGTPPVAPALASAIVDAGGNRVRDLPIVNAGYEVRR